jgi:hypothetical protein
MNIPTNREQYLQETFPLPDGTTYIENLNKTFNMQIQNQTLDFVNEVNANPYHMKYSDFGDFSVRKIIKLSNDFYIVLDYTGHFETYYDELKERRNYTPIMLFSLYFLGVGEKIETVVSDYDYLNRFNFSLTCLKNYVSAIDQNHGKPSEAIVTIFEGPSSRTSLGFYPDSDDVALNYINFDEEQAIASAVLLTSNVVLELYDIFKILCGFDFYIDKLEDNIELAQHEQPKYKLEKVGSARYETVSATWNEKEYMPTHQIIKHYKIDEVSLKKVYNDSGEYWVDWFTSDDVDFISIEFLNKMNIEII